MRKRHTLENHVGKYKNHWLYTEQGRPYNKLIILSPSQRMVLKTLRYRKLDTVFKRAIKFINKLDKISRFETTGNFKVKEMSLNEFKVRLK